MQYLHDSPVNDAHPLAQGRVAWWHAPRDTRYYSDTFIPNLMDSWIGMPINGQTARLIEFVSHGARMAYDFRAGSTANAPYLDWPTTDQFRFGANELITFAWTMVYRGSWALPFTFTRQTNYDTEWGFQVSTGQTLLYWDGYYGTIPFSGATIAPNSVTRVVVNVDGAGAMTAFLNGRQAGQAAASIRPMGFGSRMRLSLGSLPILGAADLYGSTYDLALIRGKNWTPGEVALDYQECEQGYPNLLRWVQPTRRVWFPGLQSTGARVRRIVRPRIVGVGIT